MRNGYFFWRVYFLLIGPSILLTHHILLNFGLHSDSENSLALNTMLSVNEHQSKLRLALILPYLIYLYEMKITHERVHHTRLFKCTLISSHIRPFIIILK